MKSWHARIGQSQKDVRWCVELSLNRYNNERKNTVLKYRRQALFVSMPRPSHLTFSFLWKWSKKNKRFHGQYGVVLESRIDKIIGLFCKRALYKREYSAKETFNFIHPTHRSYPILPSKDSAKWELTSFCSNSNRTKISNRICDAKYQKFWVFVSSCLSFKPRWICLCVDIYMYMYIKYIYAYINIDIYTYTCVYYVHIHKCVCICKYIHTYINTNIYICTCTNRYTYMCMTYMYIYMRMYI